MSVQWNPRRVSASGSFGMTAPARFKVAAGALKQVLAGLGDGR